MGVGKEPIVSVLSIRLLGDFQVIHDGRPIAGLQRPRLQMLVAWLALHAGIPQSRLGMATRFWTESSEEQARTNLRKLLFELRQALPDLDRLLIQDKSTIELRRDGPFTLDVREFEQAARDDAVHAIDLYSGDLLPNLYDDWIIEERERLQRLYQTVLWSGIARAEAESDLALAIRYAERLLRLEPLQEEIYRTLMRLYAVNDDPARAVATYQLCSATLQRELGIEPSERTQKAYVRLLRHRVTDGAQDRESLVGRSREMTALQDAWWRAESGEVTVAVLTGEAGIGKTRLVEELAEWGGHRGARVVAARCYAAERTLTYAPIAALLRASPVPSIDPLWLTEVARLAPDVVRDRPGVHVPEPLTEQWQQQRLFEALARFFLAHQPLLLLVDDIQWCDPDTVTWLHYLLRFDAAARLLLVVTLRTEAIGAEAGPANVWADLKRRARVLEIELGPLDAAATEDLARQAVHGGGDLQALNRLVQESEGNPLFVLEMARAGDERAGTIPPTIRAIIEERLHQLSPEARALAELAATIGRTFSLPLLVQAADQSETDVVRALDELWRSRIVQEREDDAYDFSHDKLREVAYADMSSARRRFLHRRVAAALKDIHADDPGTRGEQVGRHLEQGGLLHEAAYHYVQAGDAARRLHANQSAVALYHRARELTDGPEQTEILLKLVDVLSLVGSWSEAESLCRQALRACELSGEATMHARCLLELGDLARLGGRSTEAQQYLDAARREFAVLDDYAGVSYALGRLGRVAWDVSDYGLSLHLLNEQILLCDQINDQRGLGEALGNIGLIYWRKAADLPRAQRYLEQQCTIARTEHDDEQQCRALCNLAIVLVAQGQYEEALRCLREQLDLARSIGYMRGVGHALCWIGMMHRHRGELTQALGYLKHALRLSRDMDERAIVAFTIREIGVLYHEIGNNKRALARYQDALRAAGEPENLTIAAPIISYLAAVYRDSGDYDRAIACDTASARILAGMGDRFTLGPVIGSLAYTEMARGCLAEACTLFARALTSFLPQVYERCEYAQRYGELLFHIGRPREARELTDTARDLAVKIGRKDIQLDAQLLSIQLDLGSGVTTRAEAVALLRTLLRTWNGEPETAAIHFTLWCVDRTLEDSRLSAADAYRHLHERRPRAEYRRRHMLLGESALPPPPRLPELPDIVMHHALDLGELLSCIERMPAPASD